MLLASYLKTTGIICKSVTFDLYILNSHTLSFTIICTFVTSHVLGFAILFIYCYLNC
jgi:hypothetical protein